MVNQDAIVYEKDLGEGTEELARAMTDAVAGEAGR